MTAPMATRDASIDGLRGVAVVAVMLGHAINFRFAAYIPAVPLHEAFAGDWSLAAAYIVRRAAGPMAEAGVFLFFAISGYLITGLLDVEERRTGSVSIVAFYIRRVCRIMPPLFLYIAAAVAARQAGLIGFSDGELVTALLFLCNLDECSWWFGHLWSLAIEEQFYIVWPLAFVLTPRRRRVPLLVGTLLALAALSIAALFLPEPPRFNTAGFSAIALGSICALSSSVRNAIIMWTDYRTFLIAAALLVAAPMAWPYSGAIPGIVPISACVLLLGASRLPRVQSVLLWKPVQVIGLSSYSLYLWQQIFLAAPDKYLGATPFLLFLPAVAWISVRFVERPFIRFGRAMSSRWTQVSIVSAPIESRIVYPRARDSSTPGGPS